MWPTKQCDDVFAMMSLITFFSSFCNLIGAAKILQRGRVRYRRDARPSHACTLGSGCARLPGAAVLLFVFRAFSHFTVWVCSISVCIALQQEELFFLECRASISGSEANFSLCRGDHWPRAATIASLLDSGCGLSRMCTGCCNGTCVK